MEGWITTKQAADLSGYNREWIVKLCRQGQPWARQIERRWWINRTMFEKWVREQAVESNGRMGPRK